MIHPFKHAFVKVFTATAVAAVVVLGGSGLTQALAQEVSFADKTVTLMHNTPPGSSVDVFCRQAGPHVMRYLPGKPKFIVIAKPGGRFLLGASHFYRNVKPDGMSAGVFATLPGQMAAGNKMPIDITNFVQVGGLGQSYIYYMRKDFGMTSADQLLNPPGKIISGAGGPNTNSQLMWRLFMNGIGAKDKYKQIFGYRGQMGQLKALRSGEINTASMLATLYLQLLPGLTKEGLTRHMFETGQIEPNGKISQTPGLNVPTFDSLWRKFVPNRLENKEFKAWQLLMTSVQLTWQFVLPPETPAKYADAWDRAFASALKDKTFAAEMKKAGSLIPFWVDRKTAIQKLAKIKDAREDAEYQAAIKSVFLIR
ncbi:hypothetical protein N9174_00400 [bacterium]|nr:hypothetical protein [bacterium]